VVEFALDYSYAAALLACACGESADVLPDVDGEGVTRQPVAAAERVMSTAVRRRRR